MSRFVVPLLLLGACVKDRPARLGAADPLEALFADLRAKTARREAFSPPKNERLGLDVLAAMDAVAPQLLRADTDTELYYALVKLSAARHDRHLDVEPVPGGLVVPDVAGSAPLRFAADYGDPYGMYVAGVDRAHLGGAPAVGDRVVAVNGTPLAEHVARVGEYYRWSTVENLWWNVARDLHARNALLPPEWFGDTVTYSLRGADGPYELTVPYLPAESVELPPDEPVYPELWRVFATETYELYRHATRDVVLLRWRRFGPTLVEDVDRLVAWASDEGVLGHALIVDATGSRGGSRGVYALQRMTARPFRSTLGNLRLSDVVPPFVEKIRADVAHGGVMDGDTPESDDGGARLLAWLEGPVTDALRAGRPYSDDVPFKLASLPADSDGVVQPAAVHFAGPLVVLLGPGGGSHLDQFAAMVVDNGLGHTIGLPAGGYSNTWEWTETLTMPGSDRPLASFMWSIGQTIRPNGEVLEGNPAPVDERVPPTAANHGRWHAELLERAYAWLDRP